MMRIPKSLFLLPVLLIVIVTASCNGNQPKHLSGNIETIELAYIRWACECPRFVEISYIKQGLEGDELANECIYIESADGVEKVSKEYYNGMHHSKRLRLTGQFYSDRGIPSNYEPITSEKPNKAKVFRYDKIEYID